MKLVVSARTLKIFFHDNCFDGTSCAAIFSDFYRKHIDRRAQVVYQGVQHRDSDPFDGLAVDGDDNACLDFRYDERMTWWFDHHVSAFQPPDRRAHFDNDQSGQKFFDPTAQSCTKFQIKILQQQFGYEVPESFAEFIKWADIIDGADFANPEAAVTLDQPATQLMTWVRHNKDPELTHRYIRELGTKSLLELSRERWIREPLQPILEQHKRTMELIRQYAVVDQGVLLCDLIDVGVTEYNSFISYYLFPEAQYTVGVVRADGQVRISVGYNRWSNAGRTHNIAAICERFGGGGHPFVGGVSVSATPLERGRQIAAAICNELQT